MENAERSLGAWQKRVLNSDMYAEVRTNLKELKIEKSETSDA